MQPSPFVSRRLHNILHTVIQWNKITRNNTSPLSLTISSTGCLFKHNFYFVWAVSNLCLSCFHKQCFLYGITLFFTPFMLYTFLYENQCCQLLTNNFGQINKKIRPRAKKICLTQNLLKKANITVFCTLFLGKKSEIFKISRVEMYFSADILSLFKWKIIFT
jgi:hypothetical protein